LWLTSQIAGELFDFLPRPQTGTRKNTTETIAGDFKPSTKSSQEQSNFRTSCPAIGMSLIEYQNENAILVFVKPILCLFEEPTFDWPQHHILEHRVVGDENVGALFLDFMPSE
jgi:hypothetical protein